MSSSSSVQVEANIGHEQIQNMDAELARALRVSMEEERARQERSAAAAASSEEAKTGEDGAATARMDAVPENDEESLLQQALAMSMAENQMSEDIEVEMDIGGEGNEEDNEDAAMQMALAMSMQGEEGVETNQQFQDPAFVNQLLGSLPGVNPDDPAIQEALRKARDEKKDDDKKDGEWSIG